MCLWWVLARPNCYWVQTAESGTQKALRVVPADYIWTTTINVAGSPVSSVTVATAQTVCGLRSLFKPYATINVELTPTLSVFREE